MATLDIAPNNTLAYNVLAHMYELTGQYEKAASAHQKEWVLGGATEDEVAGLSNAWTTSGFEGYWQWILDYLTNSDGNPELIDFATAYTNLGDNDQAFELLEKAYQERDGSMIYLNAFPRWDPIRDDPRFTDLLLRMKLEP